MRKLRIGLDFDGVVAYNPFRVIRAPITIFKRQILRSKRLKFYIPKYWWQIFIWKILHESSVFPARGTELLKELVKRDKVEVYLITARFNCLNQNLNKWLVKYELKGVFKKICANVDNEQPHEFKKRMVAKNKCDYYVEDNLDIVQFLDRNSNIPVCWVFNMVDKNFFKRPGFHNLEEALKWIMRQKT